MFAQAAVPCLNAVAEARVNTVHPLKIGDFGFVYTKKAIMVGQGKGILSLQIAQPFWRFSSHITIIKNGWQEQHAHCDNGFFQCCCSVEHWDATLRAYVIPEVTASFLTKQFGLINQICFLSLLSSSPDIPAKSTSFELTTTDHTLYQELQSGHHMFTYAMTLFVKKQQNDS